MLGSSPRCWMVEMYKKILEVNKTTGYQMKKIDPIKF